MKMFAFALALGISIGYFYGFADAQKHKYNVVSRTVSKVGGKNRENFRTDVDNRTASVR